MSDCLPLSVLEILTGEIGVDGEGDGAIDDDRRCRTLLIDR